MGRTKMPEVMGLMFCKEFAVDAAAHETSLRGLFQSSHWDRFPTPLVPMTVFATFYDGVGEGIMELMVTRLADERDIYRHQRWFVFPGRFRIAYHTVQIHKLWFPTAGRYTFSLRFNDEILTRRVLDVFSTKD